jgi:ribosomal protein L14E/L6E/L27E
MDDGELRRSRPYPVGFGRPPRATQFQPGKSGNPKGRPKGSRSVAAIVQEILHQKVYVTEGDKTRRIPRIEVAVRRLVNEAMKGDPRAMKQLLDIAQRYALSDEAVARTEDLSLEDQVILEDFLRQAAPKKTSRRRPQSRKATVDGAAE